jgi:hypothetical protein
MQTIVTKSGRREFPFRPNVPGDAKDALTVAANINVIAAHVEQRRRPALSREAAQYSKRPPPNLSIPVLRRAEMSRVVP